MPRRKRQRKIIMPSSDAVVSPQDSLTGEMDVSSAPEKEPKLANPIVSDAPSMDDLESSPTLCGLIEDMFIEISLYLAPLDLLHLSWTNTSLHRMMTTGSFAWVWKWARTYNSGLKDIPDCPSDLGEPQYANLMFGQHCFYCLREADVIDVKTSWRCRTRACIDCIQDEELFKMLQIEKGMNEGYLKTLMRQHLPFFSLESGKYTATVKKRYYHLETHELWKREYKALKRKRQWLENKLIERKLIDEHATECSIWLSKWKKFIVEERKELILTYLEKLGWKRELSKTSGATDKLLATDTVKKACEKRLLDADLVKLNHFFEKFMLDIRERRRLRERKGLLQTRIPVLVKVIENSRLSFPPNYPTPHVADVFWLPLVQDLIHADIDGEFTAKLLDPFRDAYPEITRQWNLDKKNELLEIIRSGCGDYSFDPDTVLDLATTVFTCEFCDLEDYTATIPLWHPRILIHSHTTLRPYPPNNSDPNSDTEMLYETAKLGPWNGRKSIQFAKKPILILTSIFEQLGFDPAVVTAAEMDAADPIFECVPCNKPRRGRFTMKWRHLIYHISNKHRPGYTTSLPTYKIEIIQGQEAELIRERLAEESGIARASDSKSTICVHCRETKDSIDVIEHLWTAHNIEDPTDADTVLNLDSASVGFRYSWPPRRAVNERRLPQ